MQVGRKNVKTDLDQSDVCAFELRKKATNQVKKVKDKETRSTIRWGRSILERNQKKAKSTAQSKCVKAPRRLLKREKINGKMRSGEAKVSLANVVFKKEGGGKKKKKLIPQASILMELKKLGKEKGTCEAHSKSVGKKKVLLLLEKKVHSND